MTGTISFPQALDHFNRGRLDEAEAICRNIVRKQKRDANAWQLLGMIHGRRGWYDKAVPCYQTCIRLVPNDPIGYVRLATARLYQGRFADARKQFDKAIALQPGFLPAVRGLAELLEREERVQEAHDLLAPAVAAHPEDAEAALLLAGLQAKTGAPDTAVATIECALGLPAVQPVTRRKLLFTLGRTLDRLDRPDDAFAAWTEANRTAIRAYDPQQADAVATRLAGVFTKDVMSRLPHASGASGASTRPGFVVGMPRSGSTLIEQIIDAHPRAHGAGEIAAFNTVIAAVERQSDGAVYPEAVRGLTPAALDAAGRTYLDALARLAPKSAERVADKNLLNFKHLGLIAIVFPHARVIHCRRDPLDNGLSCFMNDLPPIGFPWASDLDHIGRFHVAYDRLMAHWHDVLPDDAILDVQYEALVADQERVSREIIAFCGLDWDDACLRFHETKRAVRTISYDQVRRPIYRTALKRWERYAGHLAPLRAALETNA